MIKAENIAIKEFRKALYGYDCEQVDRYLDEIIVQLRQMEQERLEMAATIEYLAGRIGGERKLLPQDQIVVPVSPHRLLNDTGHRRLAEDASPKRDARKKTLNQSRHGKSSQEAIAVEDVVAAAKRLLKTTDSELAPEAEPLPETDAAEAAAFDPEPEPAKRIDSDTEQETAPEHTAQGAAPGEERDGT